MDSINKTKISGKQYFTANPFWAKAIFLDDEQMGEYVKIIDALPENVKYLLYSVEATEIIISIGQKNNLNNWQINKLANSTGEIISAQIPIAQFISSIAQELQIPVETARAIAQEINVKIFSKAALQIKRLQENKFSNSETRNPAQSATPRIEAGRQNPIQTSNQNFHKPEERIVNLQKRIDEKPKFVEAGPKVEGNVVDLSH